MTTNNGVQESQPLAVDFKEAMARTWFKGDAPPATLSVGLSSVALSEDSDEGVGLGELEAGEPEGLDYRRGMLLAADWEVSLEDGDVVLVNPRVGFVHAGEAPWPGVRTIFISTTATKGGILVAAAPIPFSPRVLAPGDTIEAEFKVRY